MSSHTIEPKVVVALPGTHAISGCDSTSCFDGKGKLLIIFRVARNQDFKSVCLKLVCKVCIQIALASHYIFFFSISGKVKVLKVIQANEDFLDAAALIGEEEVMSNVVKETLERMICSLYQAKMDVDGNDARYRLFSQAKKTPLPQSLPPTKDALYLHFDGANYQCQQWKKALDRQHELPDPINHGWVQENGSLSIQWATHKPAPESILAFVSCDC